MKNWFITWGGLRPAIEKGPQGPVFRPFRWVGLPLLLLLLITWLVRISNFDLAAEKAIYTAGQGSWAIGQNLFWKFLYDGGTVPAGLVAVAALVGFFASMFFEKLQRWRLCFLFIILVGALGSGVVTNLVLKEYWGRPRPREVEGLGGQNAFEPVLTIDKTSSGKSFPCGHATMGYFFMGGFFLLRRYRRDWAWFFLIFGGCLGFFMGVARMCQGGHFFSDVIWSGGVMYFTSLILFYALKLHRGIDRAPPGKTMPGWMKVAVPVAGIGLIVGILLASPYRNVRKYRLKEAHSQTQPLMVTLILKAGSVSIVPGENFAVDGEAWGHGVPTSKVAVHYVEIDRGDYSQVVYKERMSGRFTEVDQDLKITLPWGRMTSLRISATDCEVDVNLPEKFETPKQIVVSEGDGAVNFESLPATFSWKDEADREKFGQSGDAVDTGNLKIDVNIDTFSGELTIER